MTFTIHESHHHDSTTLRSRPPHSPRDHLEKLEKTIGGSNFRPGFLQGVKKPLYPPEVEQTSPPEKLQNPFNREGLSSFATIFQGLC